MFTNRITPDFNLQMIPEGGVPIAPVKPQQILPMVTVDNIYQAAAELAYRDYELDRLFNAEYYNDHGSGI